MSQVVHISVDAPAASVDSDRQHLRSGIHPHLLQSANPLKGREFRASGFIPKGTCLLIDRPYAIIPVVDEPTTNDNLICSNPACNQASRLGERAHCPQSCSPDVAWCSSSCRSVDKNRHSFECTWLKRYASSIRKKWSEYDFGMLWLVVRILATRQLLAPPVLCGPDEVNFHQTLHQPSTWRAIDSLCGSSQTWPHDRVRFWSILVKKYLQNSDALPHGMTKDALLHLICQEEANSFGLYPQETGSFL
ncbi:hypothetical protein N7470_007140 [Penicillium chermesinum]|nr:hypothetical protein N7470_007140 [Penicillium chermesinum]